MKMFTSISLLFAAVLFSNYTQASNLANKHKASCSLTVTTSTLNNVRCNGGNNGMARANASGGTLPYTYSWAPTGGVNDTASNLTAGSYTVTVTDAASCVATASVFITQPVQLTITIPNDTVCNGKGLLTPSAYGGTPPYTYLWSNGYTTYTDSAGAGTYTLTITDGNACSSSASGTVVVEGNIPSFSVTPTITNATCAGTMDGSIVLSCSGITAPYKYEWGKVYGDSSYNNINPGTYTVTIRDKNNSCNIYTYTVGNIDTCNYISGTTFNDTNFNCVHNTGEPWLHNSYITITPGSYVVYPNWAGNFDQYVPYGTYTVTQNFYAGSPFASCAPSQVVTVNASSPTVNFADTTHAKLSDPMITYFFAYPFTIGDTSKNCLFQLKNNGSDTSSGKVFFTFYPDSAVTVDSTSPHYALMSHDTVYWNYSGLLPGDTINYTVYIHSENIYAGHVFDLGAAVIPNESESNPGNDYGGGGWLFADSHDPNGKQVSPVGEGPQGYIEPTDSVLTYSIHFQNNGKATAKNIYIVDTILSHLDINTLMVLGSSNTYSYVVTGNRVKFIFNNINLPDSAANPKGSVGWIQYQVHQNKANNPGDVINNTAYIYFDYNAAVATNTTVNTLKLITSSPALYQADKLSFYPNPATNNVSINYTLSKSTHVSLQVIDLLGRTVLSDDMGTKLAGKQQDIVSVKELSAGTYILRLQTGNSTLNKKLIILR